MNIEEIRDFTLDLPMVEESCPFGPDNLVFKTNSKMFLLIAMDESPLRFNVKCNPENAIQLREQFPNSVLPGYHMNKKHWNTIVVQEELSSLQLKQFIVDSYNLVQKRNLNLSNESFIF